jgi:hypothetical protein
VLVLFGNEGRDAGLEEANTAAEKDQANDERCKCATLVGHNLRDGGNDDQEVANSGEADGDVDGLELSPVLIGNPAT